MYRRNVLKTVAAASAGGISLTAGCSSIAFFNCGPGETELGALEADPAAFADQPVSIEADITSLNGDERSILINDSTAKAEVFPGEEFEYDKDRLSNATCVEGDVSVMVDRTKALGHLALHDEWLMAYEYVDED